MDTAVFTCPVLYHVGIFCFVSPVVSVNTIVSTFTTIPASCSVYSKNIGAPIFSQFNDPVIIGSVLSVGACS